jgi:hypothetical protein
MSSAVSLLGNSSAHKVIKEWLHKDVTNIKLMSHSFLFGRNMSKKKTELPCMLWLIRIYV